MVPRRATGHGQSALPPSFVDDWTRLIWPLLATGIEHRALSERTNVQIAQIVGPDHIRIAVWETRCGITLAVRLLSCARRLQVSQRGSHGRAWRIDYFWTGALQPSNWREVAFPG